MKKSATKTDKSTEPEKSVPQVVKPVEPKIPISETVESEKSVTKPESEKNPASENLENESEKSVTKPENSTETKKSVPKVIKLVEPKSPEIYRLQKRKKQ